MFYFPRAAVTNYHKLKTKKCVVSQFWSWKSKIKVLAGLIPSEGYGGRVCFRPL